jgi:hypothetical protein
MSKPRNIVKVIEAIKKELEKHGNEDGVLVSSLDHIAYQAGFRAPEVAIQSWHELMTVLNRHSISTKTEPGLTIAAIIRDEIDVGARD